jgi:hypothetical protein
VELEWYSPKTPNHDWRHAFSGAGPAADESAAAPTVTAAVDEISEMIEFKAERCVWYGVVWWGFLGGLGLRESERERAAGPVGWVLTEQCPSFPHNLDPYTHAAEAAAPSSTSMHERRSKHPLRHRAGPGSGSFQTPPVRWRRH